LILSNNNAAILWQALQVRGARPVGQKALEVLRIEAGIPRYGIDMDESNVVTETALDDAVSYTKGCYVGQEIIARIKYRGHVAKKLSGLICDQGSSPQSGNTILSTDGKEIGRVTSTTHSPQLGQTIALGYLKFDYLTAGTAVKILSGNDSCSAFVTELPFIKREVTNN
jgi:folate-binding protein YgfZ